MNACVASPWDTVLIVHGAILVPVWFPDLFGTSQSILPRLRTGKICSPWFSSSCYWTFHFMWLILFIPDAFGKWSGMKTRIETREQDVPSWFKQYNNLWRKSILVIYWIYSKCFCVFYVQSSWMFPKTTEDEEQSKTMSLLNSVFSLQNKKEFEILLET